LKILLHKENIKDLEEGEEEVDKVAVGEDHSQY